MASDTENDLDASDIVPASPSSRIVMWMVLEYIASVVVVILTKVKKKQ
jgi:hypothetical protein